MITENIKKPTHPRTTETKIANVTYIVKAHFNSKGQTAEQIISRLIEDAAATEIRSEKIGAIH